MNASHSKYVISNMYLPEKSGDDVTMRETSSEHNNMLDITNFCFLYFVSHETDKSSGAAAAFCPHPPDTNTGVEQVEHEPFVLSNSGPLTRRDSCTWPSSSYLLEPRVHEVPQ